MSTVATDPEQLGASLGASKTKSRLRAARDTSSGANVRSGQESQEGRASAKRACLGTSSLVPIEGIGIAVEYERGIG
ncbi:MAG: hypothetical protein AB7F50_04070 [Fimbriimonadaceae bacterium]